MSITSQIVSASREGLLDSAIRIHDLHFGKTWTVRLSKILDIISNQSD